jgi:hypothetical protein
MKITQAEKKHIEAHRDAFTVAIARTSISVWQNAALIGLNKIREPIAFQAALKATGYPIAGLVLPKEAGQPRTDTQALAEQAFEAAVDAAAVPGNAA